MRENLGGDVSGNRAGQVAGKARWRNASMTTDILTGIEADLAMRCRHHDDADLLERLEASGLDVGHAASALELARSCHPPKVPARLGLLLAELAPLVPKDDLATLTALVALRPLLRRAAGRLARSGMARDEARSVTLAAALEVLSATEGPGGADTRRRVATAVWDLARNALRRDLRYRRLHEGELEPCIEPVCGDEPDVGTVLAWAVGHGVVQPHHARLVAETRMAGRPLVEVAAEWGVPAAALTSTRRRAEARLRRALLAEGVAE